MIIFQYWTNYTVTTTVSNSSLNSSKDSTTIVNKQMRKTVHM